MGIPFINDDWRRELKESVHTLDHLEKHLRITRQEKEDISAVMEKHPMRITHHYLGLIDQSDPDDPIRKMIIPSADELSPLGQYDTSGELANTRMPGLQHKYAQTALILATNRCATYCRYCFRKRLVGLKTGEVLRRFQDAVRYIREHEEITNVLISGGDPLTLATDVIAHFLEKLSDIEHLRFIRFGTKILVSLPDRILQDQELLHLLREYNLHEKSIVFVTHICHPHEISKKTVAAIAALKRASIVVSNQAVLLRGVNDTPEILAELHMDLLRIGVHPYYLFQCRPVKMVKHMFQLPLYRGLKVVEAARELLSGPSKSFRYVMSHRTGKIEILGAMNEYMYFKYHQAKNPEDVNRFFRRRLDRTSGWLDEMGRA